MKTDFKPKLQILITQFNETEDMIKPLLDSIAIQQRVDLEKDISVIIVNDGSNVHLSREFLCQYKYRIDYILADHKGVSGARNEALDHATADYVMWCDADDSFYITHALWLILRDISNGFDLLNSIFLEEVFGVDGNLRDLIKREHDRTFVHGKVYRREYLTENNIRWNEDLHVHEDVYFTSLAMFSTNNIKYQETFFYLWKYRKESICRTDPKYMLNTYVDLLNSNDALLKELIRRENEESARYIMTFVTFDLFYSLQLPIWHEEENQVWRDKTEKRFSEMWKDYKEIFWQYDGKQRTKTANLIRDRMRNSGMGLEVVAFPMWIEHIEELGEMKGE